MNFLTLTQRLRQEAGASGTGPVTVISQAGELARMVSWINSAWMDIQSVHQDWEWLRSSASFPTVASQATYTPAQCGLSDFGMWARDTFRNYDTSVGTSSEVYMEYVEYEAWRDSYQYGALRSSTSRPMVMTITPAKAIGLGPVPLVGYTVTGDYFKVPTEMTLDADIPALPTQFHMAIVWRALVIYGYYEENQSIVQRGQMEFDKIIRRMAIDRLPEATGPGALA